MPPGHTSFPTEALLAQSSWIRSLARSLVGDSHRADDLAQDTWLRALQNPPGAEQSVRGWLATVMRNLVHQERRSDVRRADREDLAVRDADPAALEPSGEGLLARATMQQELVRSVLELDEPYRSTVLLRYFEELPPRRIATMQSVPVSTVKTRLARALSRLRTRLDTDHGGDGAGWVAALLPVLREPGGLSATTPLSLSLGALAVNSKVVVFALALTALGTGYYLSRPADGGAPPAQASGPDLAAAPTALAPRSMEATTPPLATAAPVQTGAARQALAAEPETQQAELEADPVVRVRGRVVDMRGQPVAGVELVGPESAPSAPAFGSSAPDGSFEFEKPDARGVVVRSESHVTVLTGALVDDSTGKEAIVVVAERIALSGAVVDEFAGPVEGARVRLHPALDWRTELGWVLDFSAEVDFRVETDALGRFEFDDAPRFPGGKLTAQAQSYRDAAIDAPTVSTDGAVLVLDRPDLTGDRLTGVVVDPQGFAVAGAQVSMGIDTVVTAEDGGFSFDLADPSSFNERLGAYLGDTGKDTLLAVHPGHLPAQFAARGTDSNGRPIWPDHVVLRLGTEPLEIRGRVIDQDEQPLAGMRVWLEDPTFFGGRAREGRRFPELTHVESELAGLDPGWPFVETDERGRFELGGLTDREYTLEAMDPDTLVRAKQSGVRAGATGVDIVVTYDVWPTVRGRIVDGRGNAVAGASVRTNCDAYRMKVQGQVMGTLHASAGSAETDSQGGFELTSVPRELAYFRIDHPDTIPLEFGRSEQALRDLVGDDHDDFEIVVQRRCHFQVALADAEEADAFEIHDANGTVLQLSEFEAGGRRDGDRFAILNGRTNMLAVGDSAASLVLYLKEEEVRRVPIELTPGEQPTLRP